MKIDSCGFLIRSTIYEILFCGRLIYYYKNGREGLLTGPEIGSTSEDECF